jgi:hypothetical protein
MTAPVRVHRRRTKGWRMPAGAVYVGRPTQWGNPFVYRTRQALARVPALDGSPWEFEGRISADGMRHDYFHADGHVTRHEIRYMTRAETVELYRQVLTAPTPQLHLYDLDRRWIDAAKARLLLAGQDLACWCPLDVPCHADVLLAVANGHLA